MALEDRIKQHAREGKVPYTSYDEALQAVENETFTLFYQPLMDKATFDKTRGHLVTSDANTNYEKQLHRSSDILVGFQADTDASFTMVLDLYNLGVERFHFSLKQGEFQLAWRNKEFLPGIRLIYQKLWIEDLQGSVRRVCCLLSSNLRRQLVQREEYPLGEDWYSPRGFIVKRFI